MTQRSSRATTVPQRWRLEQLPSHRRTPPWSGAEVDADRTFPEELPRENARSRALCWDTGWMTEVLSGCLRAGSFQQGLAEPPAGSGLATAGLQYLQR